MVGVQVLLQGGAKMEYEPNPFASEGGDELAAVAYRCSCSTWTCAVTIAGLSDALRACHSPVHG